jgi:hypothetical protein
MMVSIVPRLLTSCRMTGTPFTWVRQLKVPGAAALDPFRAAGDQADLVQGQDPVGFPGRHQHMVGIVGQQVDDPTHIGGSAHALTLVVEQDHDVAGADVHRQSRAAWRIRRPPW